MDARGIKRYPFSLITVIRDGVSSIPAIPFLHALQCTPEATEIKYKTAGIKAAAIILTKLTPKVSAMI